MIEPSLLIHDGRIRGIARPFQRGDGAIYWEIDADPDDETWSAKLTPMKVNQQTAPYIFARGDTLLALITDRNSINERG
ncbi:hypothetical protein ACFL6S_34690, partial [Candidatus Poribacteria bacterium]